MENDDFDLHVMIQPERENMVALYTFSVAGVGICYGLPLDNALHYLKGHLEHCADELLEIAAEDAAEDAQDEEREARYHNYYRCHHEGRLEEGRRVEEWDDDECDSMHNDHCPICNAEIEPYLSEELDEAGKVIDTINHEGESDGEEAV